LRSIEPSTAPRPLKVALVGCGNVADKHIDALTTLDDAVDVIGIAEPDSQARRRVSDIFESPGFEGLHQLLAGQHADLVTLATPTGLHPDQAVCAAESGAHVLTEKPLGTSLEDAQNMVRRVDDLNRRLFVVKQLRHHPLFLAVRDAVQQGRFGQIHTIGLQIFWTRPQTYYDSADWRGTREFDGGALMNQASHYVDLLDWLFGPVAEVQAIGGALGRNIEVEDTAVVSLAWEEGFVGSLHVTMLAYPNNVATSLTVVGERGTIRLGGPMCDRIEAWNFADSTEADDGIEELASTVPEVLARGHQRVYRNVIADLQGDEAQIVDGRQGLRSLAIIDAAYKALHRGSNVDVPSGLS